MGYEKKYSVKAAGILYPLPSFIHRSTVTRAARVRACTLLSYIAPRRAGAPDRRPAAAMCMISPTSCKPTASIRSLWLVRLSSAP